MNLVYVAKMFWNNTNVYGYINCKKDHKNNDLNSFSFYKMFYKMPNLISAVKPFF